MNSNQNVQFAITAYVQRVVSDYANDLISITLYGSQARGEASPESDIDLFVVVKRRIPELEEALIHVAWEIQFEHDVVIADVIRGLDELEHLQYEGFPYYQSLEREGILLWMNPSVPMPDYVGSVPLKN